MSEPTLFDNLVKREDADDSLSVVDVDMIKVSDYIQPAQSLIDSIREHGVIQPVLLQLLGGKYKAIDGRRRILACKALGIETIPAMIRSNAEDLDASVLSIVGNLERSDNTLSESVAVRKLVKAGATRAEIIDHLHMTPERFDQILTISSLPEKMLKAVEDGKVATSTAVKVAKLSTPYQKEAIEKFEESGKLTGKDVDQVKEVKSKKAVQDVIGTNFIPIPKTPVEIAQSLMINNPVADHDVGWNSALATLIDKLEA